MNFIRTAFMVCKAPQTICTRCCKILQSCNYSISSQKFGKWEPDNLNPPPEIPEYDVLNIQMKGYDYPVLESYSTYVHRLADTMGLETDSYAVPGKSSQIDLYYPSSIKTEHTYNLTKYERVVQIEDVPSTLLQVFVEAMKLNAPAGVEVTIKQPDPVEEEDRYIPDKELIALQEKAAELEETRSDLKKGKVN